jgi:hypothetical protein
LKEVLLWPFVSSLSLFSPSRYNMGPNGGILTSLNLFATKFDQVLDFVDRRASTVE